MIEFVQSRIFSSWLDGLRDVTGKARIIARIRSAEHGNLGDCEPVGNAVYEMRIHSGPGYRVYFARRDSVLYLLLAGGDKSTQKRDIKRAVQIAQAMGDEE
ncbi:type II toxin-antitoxin system RelE/ParE family toxin [Pseudomonas sp. FP198]|jgi:putative addiction module killer protein|uniref:type II toxin-antitoxin system RelE/ParE family toxin n=1 Tax=Pseudomonas sp. FP198 TaxID=2954084 RepID=UPI002732FA54|nr:type II toxin-antitoxin system RelE/ParE family toxin [Pseudomonas sp. FP198]WLG95259.1 type II toxin-antitoxin system RelE/ParE family toxin [Pseudomonas sp. FP198]